MSISPAKSSEILTALNPVQRAACQKVEGPVLVVAGAGSGKTLTLTHRIAYLIAEQQIAPQKILAVTFTNKAAQEMQQRLQKLLHGLPILPTVGTFHAISAQILRREIHHLGLENSFNIFDDSDSRAILRQILKEFNLSEKIFNPRALLGAISAAKANLVAAENYAGTNYFEENVAKIYPVYEKRLRAAEALDFGDLLKKTVELFQEFPEILKKYQTKWEFISVDEFQDVNQVQAVLTNLLAARNQNLCVIGDPDQSIYSWRGADIRNILEFKKKYPEAQEFLLEQNYRSSPVILAAANAVIAKNPHRQPKKLWTQQKQGEKIFLTELADEREEAEFIVQEILERVQAQKNSYRDFVVLYRTNAQSRALEEVFLRNALPHRIIGSVKFYARKEIKDLIAYLQVIQNPRHTLALLRILNVPLRTIGPRTIAVLQNFPQGPWAALENVASLELPESKKGILQNFYHLIKELQELSGSENPASLIKNILLKTKLKKFWLKEGQKEGQARYENALELTSVAAKHKLLEPRLGLATFLEEVALLSGVDEIKDGDNRVTLMTLHTCKGLEFPIVFIAGCEQNILPHASSLLDPKEYAEERRLFYVGLTRAKQALFLLTARNRLFFGETNMNAPSKFLADIPRELLASPAQKELKIRGFGDQVLPTEESSLVAPEDKVQELPQFKVGDKIKHLHFGFGEIQEITEDTAVISFQGQSKKFLLAMAPIKKVEEGEADEKDF